MLQRIANVKPSLKTITDYYHRMVRRLLRGKHPAWVRETIHTLITYMDRETKCWPSIREMAADLGITYDAMRKRLREIERLSIIARISRFERNGRQATNGYIITFVQSFWSWMRGRAAEIERSRKYPPPVTSHTGSYRTKERLTSEHKPQPAAQAASPPSVAPSRPIQPLSAQAEPEVLAGQPGKNAHDAPSWRWWRPARRDPGGYLCPVDGEARDPGTVVGVVRRASEVFGSSFLASLLASPKPNGGGAR